MREITKRRLKVVLTFIGLKIAEIIGFCLFVKLFWWIGSSKERVIFMFLSFLTLLVLLFISLILYMWVYYNWEKAKQLNGTNYF